MIKRRLAGGEFQQFIAEDVCINMGRISETNTGQRFSWIPANDDTLLSDKRKAYLTSAMDFAA